MDSAPARQVIFCQITQILLLRTILSKTRQIKGCFDQDRFWASTFVFSRQINEVKQKMPGNFAETTKEAVEALFKEAGNC